MNELTVKVNEVTLPTIEWNKEEVLNAVKEIAASYDGLVFEEDNLPIAKKDLASIRKDKKALNEHKKNVKKLWNKNYLVFEDDIKEAMSLLENVENDIDTQVKEYEEKQREEKKQAIIDLEEYQTIKDYITFDDKWLLKGSKFDDIIEELNGLKERIEKEKNSIKLLAKSHNINPERYVEMLKSYNYEEVSERIIDVVTATKELKEEVTEKPQLDPSEPTREYELKITCTLSALKLIKEYAESIGVKLERL